MRWKLVSLALGAACTAAQLGIGMEALAGDQTPAGAAEEVVYLDASALARLQPCTPMLLLTSNPPQWRIRFRLDHTRYLATVFVTDDPPRPLAAR